MPEVDATRTGELPAQAAPDEEGMLTLGLHHWKLGDVVEAYKWLILAADYNNPYANIHEKELVREMTAEEVTESRRRASAFRSAPLSIDPVILERNRMPADAIV